jgi:hypothetical protein
MSSSRAAAARSTGHAKVCAHRSARARRADRRREISGFQRGNGHKTEMRKTTRHSEKTVFSLGNAFFLQ